jgi:hypothetical protein
MAIGADAPKVKLVWLVFLSLRRGTYFRIDCISEKYL